MDSLKTEEHIEKVMFSDLQTPEIKKAMKVQVLLFLKAPAVLFLSCI